MKLDVHEFTYSLPPERIAQYPLDIRDQSKLLVYDKGLIHHENFLNIADFLPGDATLFFNETKVIPARLHFQKETGASIEIFLLRPITPSALLTQAMLAVRSCSWSCTIGNQKRWTSGTSLFKKIEDITLEATLKNRDEGIVEFKWYSPHSFAEVLQKAGKIPLPPYLKREAEEKDKDRYQTVYSAHEGAVAAPTAGLHFTPAVFKSLKKKKVQIDFLTLHVSAGTFQPIKVKNAVEHVMHQEQIIVTRENVEHILQSNYRVAVGTTSLRTLESLYWYGVKLLKDPAATFHITQQDPYTQLSLPSPAESLQAVIHYMDNHKKDKIQGETAIYILPGYAFRICQALITNFHQPGSTLMLLVAAFIGSDWKKVYEGALQNGYRFLSYGDSSLLIPKEGSSSHSK